MYVKFDKDSGKIISIRGTEYDGDNCLPVALETVKPIILGEELSDNFEVRYNVSLKEVEFVRKSDLEISAATINDFIYEIPQQVSKKIPDLLVIQDIKNTCWKFVLNPEVKSNFESKGVTINERMMFSVTAKGDPNVLYKLLFVELGELARDGYVVLPFNMPFEYTREPISIFTSRKFSTYQFKRIFNE